FKQRNRQRPARAEQVDLEDQEVAGGLRIQYIIQRRVGRDATVPEMLAVNFDGRKARWQRARGHDMFRSNFLAQLPEFEIIEVPEIAAGHAHRADAEPSLQ